jgi:hypothetical protein
MYKVEIRTSLRVHNIACYILLNMSQQAKIFVILVLYGNIPYDMHIPSPRILSNKMISEIRFHKDVASKSFSVILTSN